MLRILTLLAVSALTLAACGPATPVELGVEAQEFSFGPNTLEVRAGQPVRLTLRNGGTLEHDFSISHIAVQGLATSEASGHTHDMSHLDHLPELHVAAAAGASGVVEFTPTEPGLYTFFCSVVGHQEAGMAGTLVVK